MVTMRVMRLANVQGPIEKAILWIFAVAKHDSKPTEPVISHIQAPQNSTTETKPLGEIL